MKKAFTLIELLIVIAIIGILASVGVPIYNNYVESSKDAVCQENFSNLTQAFATKALECANSDTIQLRYRTHVNDLKHYPIRCDTKKFTLYADYFINHFDSPRIGNQYKPSKNRVLQPGRSNACTVANKGFIWVSVLSIKLASTLASSVPLDLSMASLITKYFFRKAVPL